MLATSKIVASAGGAALAALCVFGVLGSAAAQAPARSARGGALAKAGGHQFEVFFYPTGLRVFATDPAGAPVDTTPLSGTATFYHPNSPDPWFTRPLQSAGTVGQSLDLNLDLTSVPRSGARVTIQINGLPSAATFSVPVEFVGTKGEAAATEPPFAYGPSAGGFGYFPPAAAQPASTTARTTNISRSSGSSGGSATGFRDPSTGRNRMRLAKPWLRPNS